MKTTEKVVTKAYNDKRSKIMGKWIKLIPETISPDLDVLFFDYFNCRPSDTKYIQSTPSYRIVMDFVNPYTSDKNSGTEQVSLENWNMIRRWVPKEINKNDLTWNYLKQYYKIHRDRLSILVL
jgi:hypothetical protein